MLPPNFSSEAVMENDNFAVTGLFRMKIGRSRYYMGKKTKGKSLIFKNI